MTDSLHFEVLAEFLRLKTNLDRVLSPITAEFGLTPVQSVMLHLISRSESATVGSIFRQLDLNQGNVSSVCKKLEGDGYIVRNKSPEDERIYVISLTDKGNDALYGIARRRPGFLPERAREDTGKEWISLERQKERFTDDELAVLAALGDKSRSADELVELTQIPVRRVTTALTMLQVQGAVEEHPGKRFSALVELER